MYHQFMELAGVDITKEPMEVGPTCHYVMGGVEVDADTGAATVPGLFAAGECSGGMHGSNRLGGNSLSDLLVFGRRAGLGAADYVRALSSRPTVAEERRRRRGQAGAGAVRGADQRRRAENPYTLQLELQQSMNDLVGTVRARRQGRDVIEKFQWITAGTVFANPFPALELVANGAVQFQMISELAGVYGVQISTSHVRMIGGQMIQMLLKLGLVETATSLIAGIFKSSLVGYAAAGAVQAVSMAYLTHVSGEAFAEYFRRGQTWGDGGMQAALIRQFDLTSRAEFLQEFAKQAVQKVSTRFLHGTDQDAQNTRRPRTERRPRTITMSQVTRRLPAALSRARPDDRRRRPRACARADVPASRSWSAASNRSTSGSRRSTPGSCSTASGRSSRHARWMMS